MIELMCRDEDLYQDCKERLYGETIIKKLKKTININTYKDSNNNLIEV